MMKVLDIQALATIIHKAKLFLLPQGAKNTLRVQNKLSRIRDSKIWLGRMKDENWVVSRDLRCLNRGST